MSVQPSLEPTPLVGAADAGPVKESARIISLDALRGVAVLGILVMNVQSFSMIGTAYLNPTAYGDLSGANFWVWVLCHVMTDQKFMTIFSMLFGAGIVLMSSPAEAAGRDSAGIHYRRMTWLILFGLLHAHLFWYGDILYTYGMCGLAVWLFRKLPAWLLALLGLAVISVASLISLFFGFTMQMWADAAFETQNWKPSAEVIAAELAAYRGGWLEQMSHRVPTAIFFETFLLAIGIGWRAGGCMLLGMALYKLGVLTAARSSVFYLTLIAVALFVGIPVVVYGAHRNFDADWKVYYSFFLGSQFNYWASILVSLGWVGAVMMLCKRFPAAWLTRSFAAVGRMALSNYLLQTILCTTIFYGHGFGLFGRVERVGQIALVFALWALQLVISPIWLRYFLFGPFEWLWRSLTYWKTQPMLRRSLGLPQVARTA